MLPSAFVALEAHAAVAQRQGGPQGAAGARTRCARPPRPSTWRPGARRNNGSAAIWQDVLGVRAGRRAGQLLRAGGDSIRSIQVLAKATRAPDCALRLEELFRHQTIEELAVAAAGRTCEPPVPRTAARELLSDEDRRRCRPTVEDAYPLVDLQAGMLFHSAYSPQTAVYHDVFSSRMRGRLGPAALARVARAAAAPPRGAADRLRADRLPRPLQLVHREVAVPLAVDDLHGARGRGTGSASWPHG